MDSDEELDGAPTTSVPSATGNDIDRRLSVTFAICAVLAIICLVLGALLARSRERVRSFESDRWFICMQSLNLLEQLAARNDDDLELIEVATNLGATRMCTGEIQPSTYECLMMATDKRACWASYVGGWLRVFKEHEPKWTRPED